MMMIDEDDEDDEPLSRRAQRLAANKDDNEPVAPRATSSNTNNPPIPAPTPPQQNASLVGTYFEYFVGSDRYGYRVVKQISPTVLLLVSARDGRFPTYIKFSNGYWREAVRTPQGRYNFKDRMYARFARFVPRGNQVVYDNLDPGF
jgi:hypothetical protein